MRDRPPPPTSARADVNAEGGPVAFVRTWLDHDSQAPQWKAERAQRLTAFLNGPGKPSL
jgi:hypothetical protein